jgi:hemolysin III
MVMTRISNEITGYSLVEEQINICSHAVGFLLSLIGLFVLLVHSIRYGTAIASVSFGVFGVSLAVLYAVSTLYHSSKNQAWRRKLRIYDHAAIYILIAGTYTPFSLLIVQGTAGWIIFTLSWLLALSGIVLKLFFTGRFRLLSTLMYLLMGWIILFVLNPLINNFSHDGLGWLLAGGLAYTVGAVLYTIKPIPYSHAIFHGFVLAGSACHFVSVYVYILPFP